MPISACTLDQIAPGDVVKVSGFTCMDGHREVFAGELGPYVLCDHGRHYLAMECRFGGEDNGVLVGIERVGHV
ncbi:LuxR family transcriptional regulator [Roseibium sp. TrichSKD4]|uniref:hypothetical protein n=1 Tax=Roseibium sp. TrichSKD4 TaxID=744980 RepID=UPI0001E56FCE|nr:hypothetical protein [Roseibium sp. TrichSKD4]EFO31351.1 LuxR family transcriptional regulator [Roseibium sp. TrichSKD4]